jgi:hypothetical protein
MAYAGNRFSTDIFISYAHIDNTERWVDRFARRLHDRLKQLQVDPEIWMDKKLGGADQFSQEIFDRLHSSAILISVISPSSVASNWCSEERGRFERDAARNGGFQYGNKVRAVNVVKTPLDGDTHHDLFPGTLGFEFYERDHLTRWANEFGFESDKFRNELHRLAYEIKDLLNRLRALPPPRPAIYVSSVTRDLSEKRDALVRQLSDWGHEAVCHENSVEFADLDRSIKHHLDAAVFSVHIVGPEPGFAPAGSDRIEVIQYETAAARGLDRIVWSPAPEQPNAGFLAAFARDTSNGFEDLRARRFDELLELVGSRIKKLKRGPAPAQQQPTQNPNIYIACDTVDLEAAKRLKGCLDAAGLPSLLPVVEVTDLRLRRKDHRKQLRENDAVLVYWGSSDEIWYRTNLSEIIKARTKRPNPPLHVYCISCAPNRDRSHNQRPDLEFTEVSELRCDSLRPFIDRLRPASNGNGA